LRRAPGRGSDDGNDKLPFIGRNTGSRHVYVATGFSGTGMTFGTLAAMLLRDAVLGAKNPWAELYGATRVKPLAQVTRYLSENVDYPTCMLRDRLHRGEVDSIDQVVIGEGRLVRDCGRMLAVYRDDEGRVHARSAVCTHMGCYVRFNSAQGPLPRGCVTGRALIRHFRCYAKKLAGTR
jgi:Rieske Fe-S protein